MRVVLDTSVLVAGWRSNRGASFELLRLLPQGRYEVSVSVPLVLEYEAVLLRHLSKDQRPKHVEDLVDYICSVAIRQDIFFLWRPLLPDPGDDMVLEVAMASGAEAVVTHNLKDFRAALPLGLRVVSPGQFLLHLHSR